jgi:large subunit ribosomal protein L2
LIYLNLVQRKIIRGMTMIKKLPGTTPALRFATGRDFSVLTRSKPLKSLTEILEKHSGRSKGRVTVKGQGGRNKRLYRLIDFRRNKFDVPGKVATLEYDPNRTSFIALINYRDGDKRYILAPEGLKVGDTVLAAQKSPLKPGNAMPLGSVPLGTVLHNVELRPGGGGIIGRAAGTSVTLASKDSGMAHLKLPSGEVRMVPVTCMATVGALTNADWKNIKLGKAGRSRHMGIRPQVRGVARNPGDHPHGGGEGRSGIGMKYPKTEQGRHALGKRTRSKNKYSDKFIVKRRGTK